MSRPDEHQPWWRSAVVYQIYPRSFADSTGDGVGDLEGIAQRLEHLVWLGVDAIWLSPVFTSPMRDAGYDVADYCDIDPTFGTLESFDRLVASAHGLGLKVLLDWVPNHTSSDHPWFVAARSSIDDPKRDWYVWRDRGADGAPPNNWVRAIGTGSAWTHDEATDQSYLHLFLPSQPDLNWANPEVEAAMHDTLRFWLDRGVDGFRMDVVHLIGKDPALASVPESVAGIPHVALNDVPEVHPLLRRIRTLLDGYDGDRVSVGEVYLLDTAKVATYYGDGDELHLSFNFPPLLAPWDARRWSGQIERVEAELDPIGAWPTWVLSNHDNPRHRTRYGTEARARAAAVLLLGLRGTPFLYAGEELGLQDAVVTGDAVVDPGGRDGCRAPIPWEAAAGHGWGDGPTWLPFAPEAAASAVDGQRADPGSIAHLYRRLLAARKASPALQGGDQVRLPGPDGVVAFERRADDDRRVVVINFTDQPVVVDEGWTAGLTVEISTDAAAEGHPLPAPSDGAGGVVLGPDQAAVLR